MSESSRKLITQFFQFFTGTFIAALFSGITVPIIIWFISPEELGKATMYQTTLILVSTFTLLGYDRAYLREYSSYKKLNQESELLYSSILIPLLFGLIIMMISYAFQNELSYLLFGERESEFIMLIVLSNILMVVLNFSKLNIRLEENGKIYAILIIFEKLSILVFVIIFLMYLGRNFGSIIAAYFCSLLATTSVGLVLSWKHWKKYVKPTKLIVQKLSKYGIPYVPAIIGAKLLHSTDKYALRIWADFEQIGLYSLALSIVMIIGIIEASFSNFWTPISYRWFESKVDNNKFSKLGNIIMTVMVISFVVLVVSLNFILKFFPEEYHGVSLIVPFLLIMVIMETVTLITGLGINFYKKTKFHSIILFIIIPINLFGNFILVPKQGALGAAISTGISFIILFWLKTIISRKLWFNFKMNHFFYNTVLVILFSWFITVSVPFLVFLVIIAVLIVNKQELSSIFMFIKNKGDYKITE
ncbi:lipopolysaccharide biosynthesis protein [Clostridiaceae bacterium HSG29]|nr:lipopolysaccharide biosynthesis protein [Clostridiaceae bacterium HSG29]